MYGNSIQRIMVIHGNIFHYGCPSAMHGFSRLRIMVIHGNIFHHGCPSAMYGFPYRVLSLSMENHSIMDVHRGNWKFLMDVLLECMEFPYKELWLSMDNYPSWMSIECIGNSLWMSFCHVWISIQNYGYPL